MKELPKIDQLSEDTHAVFDVLSEQSDLAAVVIGASYIDSALASLLQAHLRAGSVANALLLPSGPLGTISARADLAYCLELVLKGHYEDIRRIARIRNLFAHSHLDLSFADGQVQQLCSLLTTWQSIGWTDVERTASPEQLRTAARNKFTLSVVLVSGRLLLTAMSEENKRKRNQ